MKGSDQKRYGARKKKKKENNDGREGKGSENRLWEGKVNTMQ